MENVEEFKIDLGKRIKRLRLERGYTQPQLAALVGKDFQNISRLERGKVSPSAFYLMQLAIALKVDMNEIYDF